MVSITLEELTQHITSAIKENLIVHKGVILNEGKAKMIERLERELKLLKGGD